MHVNSVVYQIGKHSKSGNFCGDRIFTSFSKNVTSDFENRAKRQAETKACIFLYIYVPQGYTLQSKFSPFSNRKFHPFCTLPVWMETIKKFNNTVVMRQKPSPKMLSKAFIDDSKNWKLWNYRNSRLVYTAARRTALLFPHCKQYRL